MSKSKSWLGGLLKQGPQAGQVGQYRRKTYILDPGTIDALEEEARALGVGVNELTRALLAHALDELQAGRLAVDVDREAATRPAPGRAKGQIIQGIHRKQ